ncbi:hypothetical protein M9H77_07211 [Catharanthus roseus]|uniref:Uncharacterized protein n=1 Tax=Catharanthus roseus TaxID=4058 RepID=A0ACC0BUC2_CATRO|nr:hypothetical protein M9H77_07211 [Catharanthus roseus]
MLLRIKVHQDIKMGYIWANSSCQRMETIGRQKMAYSKLARARSNCYKNGDYGGNAYGGSHHRDGHSTLRSQMGIGNFSSRAKAFDHIPCEDCYKNGPYDVHKKFWGQNMENEGKMDDYSLDKLSASTFILMHIFEDESLQGGADGMTQKRHENMESFQGLVTSCRARKIEEEMQRIKLGRV